MEYCRAYWKNLPLFLFIKYWMVQTGKAKIDAPLKGS